MATNWNVREAAKAISANEKTAIIDLGRRFPLATIAIARIKDQAAFDFLQIIPEHITMRKIEQILKGEEETTAEESAEDEGEEAEIKPETTAETKSETNVEEYNKMNRKQLKELIIKAGGEKRCREEFGWTSRDQLIAYINKYGLDPVNEGEEEVTEEETTDPYEGKTAVELFKECKKRKIKAEPKKPAKFYADLLRKADAEATKASEETEAEDEDDWGEEEEESAKPAKKAPAKEKAAKPVKATKPAKKEEPEEDEDDWDI